MRFPIKLIFRDNIFAKKVSHFLQKFFLGAIPQTFFGVCVSLLTFPSDISAQEEKIFPFSLPNFFQGLQIWIE